MHRFRTMNIFSGYIIFVMHFSGDHHSTDDTQMSKEIDISSVYFENNDKDVI